MTFEPRIYMPETSSAFDGRINISSRSRGESDQSACQSMLRTSLQNHRPVALPILASMGAYAGPHDEPFHQKLRRKTPAGIIARGYDGYNEHRYTRPFKHLILQNPNVDNHAASDHLYSASAAYQKPAPHHLRLQQPHYKITQGHGMFQQSLRPYGQTSAANQTIGNLPQAAGGACENAVIQVSEYAAVNNTPSFPAQSQIRPSVLMYQHDRAGVKHIHEPIVGLNEGHEAQLTIHDSSLLLDCDLNAGYRSHYDQPCIRNEQPQPYRKSFTARLLDLPKGQRDYCSQLCAGDPKIDQRTVNVKVPHDTLNISSLPEQGSKAHEYPITPNFDTHKPMSYPDHVLSKANALYATMIAEAQRVRDENNMRLPAETRVQVPEGFACLEAPRALEPNTAKSKWPIKSNQPRQNGSHRSHQSSSALPDKSNSYDEVKRGPANAPADLIPSSKARKPRHEHSAPGATKRPHPDDSTHTLSGADEPPSGDLISAARSTYQSLRQLCIETGEAWTDPMHLAGCFAYAIGELPHAAHCKSSTFSKQ